MQGTYDTFVMNKLDKSKNNVKLSDILYLAIRYCKDISVTRNELKALKRVVCEVEQSRI